MCIKSLGGRAVFFGGEGARHGVFCSNYAANFPACVNVNVKKPIFLIAHFPLKDPESLLSVTHGQCASADHPAGTKLYCLVTEERALVNAFPIG